MQASSTLATALRLAALLLVHTLLLKLVEVAATAGFIGRVGVRELPWLWLADTLTALAGGALLARRIDRAHRGGLLAALLAAFGAAYLGCDVALRAGAPPEWVFTAAYMASALQVTLIPSAFWPLANDLLSVKGEQRYSLVAAGGTAGQLAGYTLAAGAAAAFGASLAADGASLRAASALCILGALMVRRQGGVPEASHDDAADLGAVLAVRGVRRLAVTVALNWVAASWLMYQVMSALATLTRDDDAAFKVVFSFYSVGSVVLILVVQALVGARMLRRIGVDRAPGLLPGALAVCVVVAAALPGAVSVVLCECVVYVVSESVDMPARHTLLGRAPPGLRGRATALTDGYAYAIGSVLGALSLLGTRSLPRWVGAAVALGAAVAALVNARRLPGESFAPDGAMPAAGRVR